MNFDSTYIKMCEMAEEIQKDWQPKEWDYCYCETEKEIIVLSGYETDGGFYGHEVDYNLGKFTRIKGCGAEGKENHIWLPRQDQLQEKIKTKTLENFLQDEVWGMLSSGGYGEGFYFHIPDWARDKEDKLKFSSMKQFWLAYIMWKMYDLVWSVEEGRWLKQNVYDYQGRLLSQRR